MSGREISLEGAFNARELGGHVTRSGRRVRPRALYRCSALHRMASAADLGVRTVLDLRGPQDVSRDADRLGPVLEHAEVRRLAMPMLPAEFEGQPTSEYLSELHGRHVSTDRYRGYLQVARDNVRGLFDPLGRADAFPVLIHCTAGKDRTGVLVALILDILGVEAEAIVADYARSNDSVETLAQALGRSLPESMSESYMGLLGAPAEAMRGLLTWLHAEHGSARGYLSSLGVKPATFEVLEAALLE